MDRELFQVICFEKSPSSYTKIYIYIDLFLDCLLFYYLFIPEPTPQYFNHYTFMVCFDLWSLLPEAHFFLGLYHLILVYFSFYFSGYSSVSSTDSLFLLIP